MPGDSDELIADLLQGGLSSEEIERLQRQPKDPDRLAKVLHAEQVRLGWSQPIVAVLQEHLFVVEKGRG